MKDELNFLVFEEEGNFFCPKIDLYLELILN